MCGARWAAGLAMCVALSLPVTGWAQSLTTTFAGGNGFNGNMFDVVAKEQVTITGVDVNLTAGAHVVEVYYRPSSYVGFESSSAGWTLLGTSSVTSAGPDQATTVPMTLNLNVPKNARYGLYVTTQGTSMQYTDGGTFAVGDVYTQDANLQILVGSGNATGFGAFFSPRIWNGTVRYTRMSSPPSISTIINQSTREDSPLSVPFSIADPDTAIASLVTTATSSNQAVVPNSGLSIVGTGPNRTLNITPAANASGSALITVIVSDGMTARQATFTVTVSAVNDAPRFTPGADVTVAEDAGTTTRTAWATNISPGGGADEANQSLSFLVSNDNLALFEVQPTISATGTLSFKPTPNASGSATVTVRLRDNGGVANTGIDTSAAVTFRITVTPVNDPPIADAKTLSTPEDTPVNVAFSGSDPEGQALTYSIVTQPMHGTLSGSGATRVYTPAANYNGSDSFTYRASDGSAQSAPATVTITISPVNDAPVFVSPTPAEGATLNASEGVQLIARVAAMDPDMDVLSIVASMLPPGASFDAGTGTLSWTPAYADTGSHTVRFTVSDGSAQSVRQFVIVVTARDSDADGLPDAWEVANNLNPNNPDSDGDTIRDGEEVGDLANPLDTDNDQIIDALDDDSDADGILDKDEAGDTLASTPPVDTDGDQLPDYRDTDSDADTISDDVDNCRLVQNMDQADLDGDAQGDVCDADRDGDTLPNEVEPGLGLNPDLFDTDGDTIHDGEEIGDLASPRDTDNDQTIDALDDDSDADGVLDKDEAGDADPTTPAVDTDGDQLPDYRDTDSDADTIDDDVDNCRLVQNMDQLDTNANNIGDACDGDVDGDGVANGMDNCPNLANPDQADLDGDDQGDLCDSDDDADGVADDLDNCPLVANAEQTDLDGDGQGDVCDDDDDADGVNDETDNCPLVENMDQADLDADGQGDLCDEDRDGDTIADASDACPDEAGQGADGCPVGPGIPDMGMRPEADMGGVEQDMSSDSLVDSGVGCGCSSSPSEGLGSFGVWAMLLGVFGLGRRRRRRRAHPRG